MPKKTWKGTEKTSKADRAARKRKKRREKVSDYRRQVSSRRITDREKRINGLALTESILTTKLARTRDEVGSAVMECKIARINNLKERLSRDNSNAIASRQ